MCIATLLVSIVCEDIRVKYINNSRLDLDRLDKTGNCLT